MPTGGTSPPPPLLPSCLEPLFGPPPGTDTPPQQSACQSLGMAMGDTGCGRSAGNGGEASRCPRHRLQVVVALARGGGHPRAEEPLLAWLGKLLHTGRQSGGGIPCGWHRRAFAPLLELGLMPWQSAPRHSGFNTCNAVRPCAGNPVASCALPLPPLPPPPRPAPPFPTYPRPPARPPPPSLPASAAQLLPALPL